MTKPPLLLPATSANEAFKSQYNNTLKWSGLAAVVLTSLLTWLSPQYTPQPYRMRDNAFRITEFEVIYDIDEPPQVAAAPVIQPEIMPAEEGDPEAVETIDIATWDPFYTPVQERFPTDDGFVASSAKPQLVAQPKPHYPEVARLARVEGTVIVKVLVDVRGEVEAAVVVRGVHPLLDNAALKAARQCVFVPGQQREIKVPTWVAVPYNFRLR